jgi:protein-tyrosine phosphatase
MVGCALLFVVVYGVSNWLASQRAHVGTWFYDWEMQIPFVPVMIVPYWSIDLFFLGSFWVGTDSRELEVLGRRIICAILVAGIFFVAMPLRIGFPRPPVAGTLGTMFGLLRAFDQPHNLFPSLHIVLWLILRAVYVRHTRGIWQWMVKLWFVLIAVSTLLTWQHQIVDVLGGLGLGVVCFYFFRETPARLPVTPNYRVGSYYAAGALVLAGAGVLWLWLFWPAFALALVATGYFGTGPAVFRKEKGGLPLSTKLLLGPVVVGQWLSLVYYRRQCRPWDEIEPGLFIGRQLSDTEAPTVGATAVLDLTCEFSEARPFLAVDYYNLPILDLTGPTPSQLREAVAFITRHVGKGKVYVHCKIGYSRSAAVVGSYLLASKRAVNAEEAVALMRVARPSLIVRPEAMEALRSFCKNDGGIIER